MAKKKTSKKKSAIGNFEESFAKVEEIVRKLEQGQIGLGESLEHYEQGVKHLKQCYDALEQAEQRIEMLTGLDREGNAKTTPLVDQQQLDESIESSKSSDGTLFGDLDDE